MVKTIANMMKKGISMNPSINEILDISLMDSKTRSLRTEVTELFRKKQIVFIAIVYLILIKIKYTWQRHNSLSSEEENEFDVCGR